MGSPHEGSVPWSSPWGASTCPAPRNVRTTLDRSAAAPAFLLLQQSPRVSSISGPFFFCVSLAYYFSTPFSSILPPSLPLAISLRPSLPPGVGLPLPLLTDPPSLAHSTGQHSLKDAYHSWEKDELCFQFDACAAVCGAIVHPVMHVQCNVCCVVQWVSREQQCATLTKHYNKKI